MGRIGALEVFRSIPAGGAVLDVKDHGAETIANERKSMQNVIFGQNMDLLAIWRLFSDDVSMMS